MTLLNVSDLTVTLATSTGDADAVRNLSFSLDGGEILGIAGESGSGKTMTALSIMGLLPYKGKASGSINFDGKEVLGSSKKKYQHMRGKEISMIFQDPMTSLHPMLTVQTQLTEHMRYHDKMSKSAARESALKLLDTVKIPDPASALRAHPSQFSGGMRQRIAIAMALACEPKLLIADEPTTALDVTVQAGILRLLHQIRDERNLSIMIITHDLGVLSSLTDKILIMYAGSEVESGPARELLSNPRHPYSQGLIAALPGASREGKFLTSIDGMPPELGNFPSGCAFHPRCGFAEDRCSVPPIDATVVSKGHRIYCPVNPFAHDRVEQS
ncbi:MAG: ABC transporter ATP-binding protein [Actinomycetia bacterium]|nr:ABC transporter ATP-binding protein [Actinomycetes bacterium]MCH9739013.1 ABC transporter ATP-binding protein [Actinomycetes bacterium]MCH9830759.1 ABC transporter ATP-binding protein [Actinomycetes bacterium]